MSRFIIMVIAVMVGLSLLVDHAGAAQLIDASDSGNDVRCETTDTFATGNLLVDSHEYSFFHSHMGYIGILLEGEGAWALSYDLYDENGKVVIAGLANLANEKRSNVWLGAGHYRLVVRLLVRPVTDVSYNLAYYHSPEAPVMRLFLPSDGALLEDSFNLQCFPAALEGNPPIERIMVLMDDIVLTDFDSAGPIPVTLPESENHQGVIEVRPIGSNGAYVPSFLGIFRADSGADYDMTDSVYTYDFRGANTSLNLPLAVAAPGIVHVAISGANCWALQANIFRGEQLIAASGFDFKSPEVLSVKLPAGQYELRIKQLWPVLTGDTQVAMTITTPSADAAILDCSIDHALFDPSGDNVSPLDRCLAFIESRVADAVDVCVTGPDGTEIKRYLPLIFTAAGTKALEWDGRDEGGRIVPEGLYQFSVTGSSMKMTAQTRVKYHVGQL